MLHATSGYGNWGCSKATRSKRKRRRQRPAVRSQDKGVWSKTRLRHRGGGHNGGRHPTPERRDDCQPRLRSLSRCCGSRKMRMANEVKPVITYYASQNNGYAVPRAASFAGKALALAQDVTQWLGPPRGHYREGWTAAPRRPLPRTVRKVPDSMPWILWNLPVKVRRPGSLRKGTHCVGTPGNPEHQVP